MTGTGPSVGKKLLFSVVAVALVLLLGEAALWAAGVGRLVDREDPFRGFSGLVRIFEPAGGVYRTRPAALATFNDQSFARTKPADGLRVFGLGGSSAYGFPWGAPAAFTAILGDVLAAAHPGHTVEAINAAGVSYAMHRLDIVADELVRYEPDIVVVYSGHNEFVEPAFFEALARRSALRNRVEYGLAHSRIYSVLDRLLRGPGGRGDRALFGTEVRRDTSRRYTDAEKREIVAAFEERLSDLVDKVQAAGSRVVLVTVPANLRDWRPEASLLDEGLAEDRVAAWRRAFEAGRARLEQGDPAAARAALDAAAAIAPGHAETRFHLARALEGLEEWEASRTAYVRACDLDASPSRRVSGINAAVRRVAEVKGALLLDADRLFAEASPHGLVGFNLIEDYVHPTVGGHQKIAWHLWEAIEGAGWAGSGATPDREVFDGVVARRGSPLDESQPAWLYNQGVVLENQGHDRQAIEKYRQALARAPDHGGALGNLARLLVRYGRYDEARPLAERIVAAEPGRSQFAVVLGVILLNQGELAAARERFEGVLAADPDSALAHHNLGRVLELQGDHAAASGHFVAALERRPDLAEFHFRRGEELLRKGDLPLARAHLLHAVGARPSADAHFYLGLLASRDGRFPAALEHYERALVLDPDHVGALVKAAWIASTAADPALRDPAGALPRARRAAELTRHRDVAALDTLAAAYAAAGRFDEAVRWQTRTVELVPPQLSAAARSRLELYRRRRSFVSD